MAENSVSSARNGRKRTTNALSAADRLEILQQAAYDAKAAGLAVEIVPVVQSQGGEMVAIILRDARLVEGRLVPAAINGNAIYGGEVAQ